MGRDYPELFILRHGQTEWNRKRRMQGHMNSPLTQLGREQAAMQNRLLASAVLPAETVFHSSTAGRARETAAIAFAGLARKVHFDDRLQEVSVGECEGLLFEECNAIWPDLFDAHPDMRWTFHAPGGESFDRFSGRLADWLAEQSHPMVVVAHGIVSHVLRGLVLGLDQEQILALPGGQGVVYHVKDGVHRRLGA